MLNIVQECGDIN